MYKAPRPNIKPLLGSLKLRSIFKAEGALIFWGV